MALTIAANGLAKGLLLNGGMNGAGGLKSVQERQERQQKTASQIAFFEGQKENLKNEECSTVEEMKKKLEKLHSYEDSIAAAKAAYNSEQMFHLLEEAKEMGEKIAEAVDKTAPKTEEERKEEMVEEALGTEEGSEGVLSDILEEADSLTEEALEAAESEMVEPEMMEPGMEALAAADVDAMTEASENLLEYRPFDRRV